MSLLRQCIPKNHNKLSLLYNNSNIITTASILSTTSTSTSIFGSSSNTPTTTTTTTQTRLRSNRSRRGLYDGKDIRTGNNVPFSLKKTKRTFKPNVQKSKRLYSEILDEMIPFHVTTSALKTIDKYGGLDYYLLRSRHVESPKDNRGIVSEGWRVRERILKRIEECEQRGESALPFITLPKSGSASSTAIVDGTEDDGDLGQVKRAEKMKS